MVIKWSTFPPMATCQWKVLNSEFVKGVSPSLAVLHLCWIISHYSNFQNSFVNKSLKKIFLRGHLLQKKCFLLGIAQITSPQFRPKFVPKTWPQTVSPKIMASGSFHFFSLLFSREFFQTIWPLKMKTGFHGQKYVKTIFLCKRHK